MYVSELFIRRPGFRRRPEGVGVNSFQLHDSSNFVSMSSSVQATLRHLDRSYSVLHCHLSWFGKQDEMEIRKGDVASTEWDQEWRFGKQVEMETGSERWRQMKEPEECRYGRQDAMEIIKRDMTSTVKELGYTNIKLGKWDPIESWLRIFGDVQSYFSSTSAVHFVIPNFRLLFLLTTIVRL